MICGAVLAGGSGTRMGSGDTPKQFLEIGGKAILIHTIGNMLGYDGFDKLLVLCPEEWIGRTEELIRAEFGSGTGIEVLAGGPTRTETLMRAVERVEAEDPDGESILVTHDGVRPFVTAGMIGESVETAKKLGASVVAVPAVDTVLVSGSGNMVDSVPDRKTLFNAQTPQTFSVSKLRKLYGELSPEDRERLTDGASIFIFRNEPVGIVAGDSSNIKITYPADLIAAEAILKARKASAAGKEES